MPTVRKNEEKDKFINRCVEDNTMIKEFPDQKQRIAVCFSIYRDRNKQKSTGETVEWKNLEDDDRGFLLI